MSTISLQTNVNALIAEQNLNVNNAFQSNTIQQLTSGYRINSSADDPAGLAVANMYREQEAELTQGVRNANDGISTLQIADGGMNNISQMLDSLDTLATQSASSTFTGDRTTLNNQFQSLLSEINREAQSIGLNSNGQFANALSIYIGGGRSSGTGALDTANGTVTMDLSNSAVDTKALGLSGMQAVAGSADLSDTSATSVSNIVNNSTNTAALATPGFTTFYMTGAGFSDNNKIAVNVNLSGVTDTETLASAINSAIQAAGNGTTAAATAFQNAGIVASVNTTASGEQQLAFTSSTAAFQVQAGDQMANALMGNFSTGSTGASMSTQVTGAAHAATTTSMTANPVYVKISGAGMANPVTLTLSNAAGTTVGSMITQLQGDLADTTNQPALAAAGITLADVSGHYTFTDTKNNSFSVQVTGDTNNNLGFGAYAVGDTAGADYTSVTGASYTSALSNTTAGAAASMEFSVGGGPAIAISPISLAGGDATAANYTSSAISNPVDITTGVNDQLNFAVDGNNVNVTLAAAGSAGTATASAAKFVSGTSPDVVLADTAAAAIGGTGTLDLAATGGKSTTSGVDFKTTAGDITVASGKDTFQLSLDGSAAKTITLADATYSHSDLGSGFPTDIEAALQSAIAQVFTGADGGPTATVGVDSNGNLTITSNSKGATSSVAVFDGPDNTLAGQLGLVEGVSSGTGANTMSVSVDGGAAKIITLANGNYLAADAGKGGGQDIVAALNTALGNAFTSDTPVASVNGSGDIVITSATKGAASNVTIQDDPSNPGLMSALGLSAGSNNGTDPLHMWVSVDGGAAKEVNVAAGDYKAADTGKGGSNDIVAALNTALGQTFSTNTPVASVNASGKIVITSATDGATSSIGITDDPTYPGLVSALGLNSAVTQAGTDGASAATIAGEIQTQANTQLAGTGAGVTVAANDGVITITNNALGAGSNTAFSAMTGNAADTLTSGTATASTAEFKTGAASVVVASPANTIKVSVDGGEATTVTLAAGTYKAADNGDGSANDIVKAMNTALKAAFNSNTPVASVNASGDLVITSASTGASSSIAVTDGSTPGLLAQLFGSGGATSTSGTAAQWAGGLFAVNAGTNRTGSNMAAAINNELQANSTLAAAGLTANWDSTTNEITVSGTQAFRMNAGAAPAQGTVTGTVDLTNGANFSASPMTLNISTDGAAAVTVNLTQDYSTAGAIAADIQSQLTAAGSNATVGTTSINGKTYLQLQAGTTGTAGSIQVLSTGTANTTLGLTDNTVEANSAQVNIGFGTSDSTNSGALGLAGASSSLNLVNASGTSQTGGIAFQGLTLAGGQTQSLTISANNSSGAMQSTTITLAATGAGTAALSNDGSGDNIDSAISYINSQLQQTDNSTLQQIVAVKAVVGGNEEINFISAAPGFQVGIGSSTNKEGLNAGVAETATGVETGATSTVSILTQSGAEAAVTAVAAAVAKLGTAQGAVGQSENQLNYAIGLAQSQNTNFAAAESRIRDADVASEAANLTKAQVLQQAAIAAMAQANSAPQAVLSLLRT